MKKFVLIMSLALSVPSLATVYYVTDGYFGTKTIRNSDSLIMTGGGDTLEGKDYSYLDIRNTSPLVVLSGGIWDLGLWGSSQLNFSGGQINWCDTFGNSTAVLSGGKINTLRSYQTVGWMDWQPVGQHIEMICKDYDYNTTTKVLTGTWGNDTAFNIQLVDVSGYDTAINNIKFTIIPEPASAAIMILGAALISARRRQ